MSSENEWPSADEDFETIPHANKPFSLRVPAFVVTRGTAGGINVMFATWFTPISMSPSSFLIAIEHKTKTYEYLNETGEFVIAAPSEEMFEVSLYAGMVSGNEEDKWEAAGLTPLKARHVKVPMVREALANVELRTARVIPYDEEHSLFIGEVLACHTRKDSLRGGIYLPDSKPLLWLGKESGAPRGNAAAPRYAAGMGRIWEADETWPLLNRGKKKKKAS